ncbi:hypothetical protein OHA27_37880 [Streptomyces sp. NBC_01619]|uniref:hypothetical protein n=1 Tax=Streptomyces sp. NBC_01619 TaxID=2975901 RepID=UPI00224DAECB|nr:hypothetical protein [Streptomyces sp. NBC_01619]MCX4515892.1 hypothetical protein [Streptomyces sp. NBC_01619]
MKRIKGPATPGRRSKPGRRWVRRIAVAVGAGTLLGTSAVPASAGVLDPWDWRYNHPHCWPKAYTPSSIFGICTGVAGNIFVPPTQPTTANIAADCVANRATCRFYPTSRRAWEEYTPITSRIPNCSFGGAGTFTFSWARTYGVSSTLGVGFTGTSNNLWNAFQGGIQLNYNHTWTSSDTSTLAVSQTVAYKREGWIDQVIPVEEIKGWYKVNYTAPHWGHYEWSTPIVTHVSKSTSNIVGTDNYAGRRLHLSYRFRDAPYDFCPPGS